MSSLFALILIVAGNVTFGRLQIQSDAPCPTATDLSASLHQLLGAELSAPSTLSVSPRDASLEVRLTDGSGAKLGERTWPRSNDCAADAQAIAVMAAAWVEDLPSVHEALDAPTLARTPTPPPRAAPTSALSLELGTGVASPISKGQSTPFLLWAVPTLQLDVGLRGAGAVAPFGSLGLFADLPREHSGRQNSWDRYTIEPLVGVAVGGDAWSLAAGAGLSIGFVQSRGILEGVNLDEVTYSSTLFDAGVVAEVRARYTPRISHGRYGFWMSLRGRAAFESKAYSDWGSTGPNSPYEAGLLVGGDYFWRR
jgi:hypothetical protein